MGTPPRPSRPGVDAPCRVMVETVGRLSRKEMLALERSLALVLGFG